jgi:ubiquinone biosynthesis protein
MLMLDPSLVPTRLLEPSEKHPVLIEEPRKPSRLRTLHLAYVFICFAFRMMWDYLRGRLTRQSFGRKLRKEFENLGGLWIKFGQLISLRSDVFPREFCVELARLQDQATGFPTTMARQCIREELGADAEHLFDEFNDAPIAAASVGQIYRARLKRNGVWVAVKIQRPYIVWYFFRDMRFVRHLVAIVRRLWFMPDLHWEEMLWELEQILAEEIDFRFEASATRRMRQNLRRHKIYVPKVFIDLCTRKIMVTEFIHAVLMADYIRMLQHDPKRVVTWCQENNVDPKILAWRMYSSMWRQMLEDNLFHGDMHPGNIILLRDSRMALIDFGTVGSMEKEYQQKYYLLIRAMAEMDFAKAADLLLMLSGALPPQDLAEVKQKLIRALREWERRTYIPGLPYREKSMTAVANDLIKTLFQYECSADWSFLRITRAQETVDQSLLHLNPDANYTKLTRKYFQKAEWRQRRRMMSTKAAGGLVRQVVETLTLPARLTENALFQGWIFRRQAQVFRGTTSKVSYFFSVFFSRMALALVIGSVYFFSVFLHQHHPNLLPDALQDVFRASLDAFPELTYPIWIVFLIIFLSLTQTCIKLKRQFALREKPPG